MLLDRFSGRKRASQGSPPAQFPVITFCGVFMNNSLLSDLIRKERKANRKETVLYGSCINDSDYNVSKRVNGVDVLCPAYKAWHSMVSRCYSKSVQASQPTYKDVIVCNDWLRFMEFRSWWIVNNVDGWHLDKDIIGFRNKEYSPDNCIYIPSWLNGFVLSCDSGVGSYAIGATFRKKINKFEARCRDSFSKNSIYLGYFDDEISAHLAWLEFKISVAESLKNKMDEIDSRIFNCVISIIKSKQKYKP